MKTMTGKTGCFFIGVFLICCIFTLMTENDYIDREVTYNGLFAASSMDYVLFTIFQRPFNAIVAPLAVCIMMIVRCHILFSDKIAVRQHSRNEMVTKLLTYNYMVCFIMIIISVLVTLVFNYGRTNDWCNYGDKNSCFYFFTQMVLDESQSLFLFFKMIVYGYFELLMRVQIGVVFLIVVKKDWCIFLCTFIATFIMPYRSFIAVKYGSEYCVDFVYHFYLDDIYFYSLFALIIVCLLGSLCSRFFMNQRDFL